MPITGRERELPEVEGPATGRERELPEVEGPGKVALWDIS